MASPLPSSPITPRTPRTPSTPSFNTKSPTIKRILQESRELASTPDPSLHASPLETNLFEWHFTLAGPPSTPYSDGIYHGRIILPPTYPLRPPSFRFLTPSGRFEVNREICLSISGHHEESWQPAWGIRTALCAIRAFMTGEAKGQVGGLDMSEAGRQRLARESRKWRCAGGCGGRTNEEVLAECQAECEAAESAGKERKEEVLPEELRLAYRDDMERGPPTPITAPGPSDTPSSGSSDSGSGSGSANAVPKSPLVAGPVANLLARSKPPPSPLRGTAPSSPSPLAASSSPSSSQSTHPSSLAPPANPPPPTATSNLRPSSSSMSGLPSANIPPTPNITPPTPMPATVTAALVPTRTISTTGVPAWIDKAILGLVATLLVMLVRKIAA
ncbi:hypothetical protein MMC19_006567 [Ptychographa xylographoides]|nr:hypothetical protein [Ptychographa xylographoides]